MALGCFNHLVSPVSWAKNSAPLHTSDANGQIKADPTSNDQKRFKNRAKVSLFS